MPEEIDEQLDPESDSDAGDLEADDAPVPSPEPRGASPVPSGPRNNTQQEVAYLRRLIDQNIPVSVKIRGGELVSGVIEYYDTSFIRLTREGQSNLFIFKKDILYLREDAPLSREDSPLAETTPAPSRRTPPPDSPAETAAS
jgi:host factor-I protein